MAFGRQQLDVMDAIATTRAMRYLSPDPIPEEVLWDILEAATLGPSAGNQQHWGWVVVRDAETKRQIAEWYREGFALNYGARRAELATADASSDLTGANFRGSEYLAHHIADAPVWVFAVLRRTAASTSPLAGASIYGAVQNLMLAARAHGIGSTITSNYVRREADVARLLGLPEDARTFALIPLGYPARGAFSRPRRLPVDEVVHWGQWGTLRPRGGT